MVPIRSNSLRVGRDPRGVVTVGLNLTERPYNVLNEAVLSELQTLLDDLEHDAAARLVIFRSDKESGFLAGADLREIYAIRSPQTADHFSIIGQKLFDRLEHLRLPTIAVIHGPCLGGGLEFALACRYRLARDDDRTRLGTPEVELGLVPAWGGTQRLSERVGLSAALRMILATRRLTAREAADLGLVDAVWPPEEFAAGIEQFVSDRLEGNVSVQRGSPPVRRGPPPVRGGSPDPAERPDRRPPIAPETFGRTGGSVGDRPQREDRPHREESATSFVLKVARRWVARRSHENPALSAACEAIARGVELGREEGMKCEREAFAELLFHPASRGRIEQFFRQQEARKDRVRMGNSLLREDPAACAAPWVDGLTIGAVLRETAKRFPSRDAAVFLQAGVRWTWVEFDRVVDRAAHGLLALGFRRGDHLGVWSTNWPEWVVLQFATARIGVVLVTINPAYRPAELEFALAQSEVRGLALIERFRSADYFQMLRQVCPELNGARPGQLQSRRFPHLQWIIRLRGSEQPGMLAWEDLEDAGQSVPEGALEAAESGLAPGDPINLQYTSGTTGLPKGALLSHRNLLLNAYYASQGQRLDERDRICIPVPLYHCFGCVLGTMCAVVRGSAMVFPHEVFDVEPTLSTVESERCTAIYGVPTMFIAELEHPEFRRRDLSSLRTGIMAGSPCPIELMKRVVHEMGAREITIAYGQTEASPLITMTRTDDPIEKRVATVGRPLPGIEVKIADLATGEPLPDGRPGELCARGHDVMLSYYNQPEQTAQAIDRDGWLHTGDLALRQPDGYFRITGRIKEIIIRGGENIAPREIEELLYQHPKVEQASVIGVPDPRFGEEVLAWIKLRAGQSATEAEIRQFCRARLAHFKTPRYIKFVDRFPTTVTGKIQKYKIRQQAIAELGLEQAATMETA